MRMTPSMLRMLRALDEQGDMDKEEISEAACVGINTLSGGGYLTTLLLLGKIRVSRWVRNVNGAPTPIYSVSPGKSKPKPKPYSNSEKTRRWRQRSGYRSPAWYARKNSAELVRITGWGVAC